MVDAIAPVNTRNDISINWKKLKPSEIIQHANEGKEIPLEVLKWAEDYLKLANAPDDVTYDSSGGVAEPAIVDAAENTEGVETPEQQKNTKEEEEVQKKEETTAAEDERQTLANSGVSLYDQGKIFIDRSDTASSDTKSAMESATNSVSKGEVIAANAEETATKTETDIKSAKTEYDNLMKKLKSNPDNITTGDLNRLNELGARMSAVGTKAQAELANYSAQLNKIETEFAQYDTVPPVASDYGAVTVGIGSELVTSDTAKQKSISTAAVDNAGNKAVAQALKATKVNAFRLIFDSHYRTGVKAITAGANALDTAAAGVANITASHTRNQTSLNTLTDAQNKVENLTGAGAQNININNNGKNTTQQKTKGNTNTQNNTTNQNNTTAKTQTPQTTAQKETKYVVQKKEEAKQKEIGAIKDTTLITDDIELKNRKKAQT